MIMEGLVVLNCIPKEDEGVCGGKYRRMSNEDNFCFQLFSFLTASWKCVCMCVLSALLGVLASLMSIGSVGLLADTQQHEVREETEAAPLLHLMCSCVCPLKLLCSLL